MDSEIREAYLERLRRRCAHADLGALSPVTDADRHRLVPLQEIFVPPEVRAEPPPIELPRELVRRLVERGEADAGELPPGVDADTLDRIRRAHREQPAVPVTTVVAEEPGRGLVLLGDPGSGKSTVARWLTLTLASSASPGGTLPVLVELRAYAGNRWQSGTLLDLIERLGESGGHGLPRAVLEDHLRSGGPALVIFDGLDEIFDPRLRDEVADEIAGFAARFPSARVVVTSRVIGYRRTTFDREHFRTFLLQDLDRPRIEQFLTSWYRLAAPPAEADPLRDRLLAAIDGTPAVAELAGNPLLLTITAVLGRNRDLPRDRRDVYDHAIGVLVAQWDPSRHLHDDRHTREHLDLGARDRLALLRRIARRMQDAPAGLAGNHLLDTDLIGETAGYLRDEHGLSPGRAKAVATAITDEFRTRNFILSHYGAGVYGFVHRAFLEYLAAADILDRGTAEQVYEQHRHDPTCEETLVLLAGMVDAPRAGRIVDRLLTADPHWFRGRPRSGRAAEPRGILLALRCLGEIRDPAALPRQRAAAAGTVITLLEHIAESRAWRTDPLVVAVLRTAGPLLARIGRHDSRIRDRVRDWYLMRGRFLRILREGEDFVDVEVPPVAQVVAPLLHDDPEFLAIVTGSVLFGPHPAVREDAIRGLLRARPGDPATAELARTLAERDPDGNVRAGMVRLFADATGPGGDALTWVRDRLADDDDRLRQGAVLAFGFEWRHHPEALRTVCWFAVTDHCRPVRSSAVTALIESWPGDPEAGALLRGVARCEPDRLVRSSAVRGLSRHWRADPETSSLLEALIADPRTPHFLRVAARDVVVDEDPRERPPARRRVDPVVVPGDGGMTVEALWKEATSSGDPVDRMAAVRALATGWPDDPDLPGRLCELVGTSAAAASQASATRAPALLERRFSEAGLWTLATTWPDRVDVRDLLTRIARGQILPDLRGVAMMLLAAVGRRDRAVLALLVELGRGRDPAVRARAAVLLATDGPDDGNAGRRLDGMAVHDAEESVRAAAVQALVITRRLDPATRGVLVRLAVGDDDRVIRQTALEHLAAGWHDDPGTLSLVRRLTAEGATGNDRAAAVRVLAGGWRDDPATGELLRRFVDEDEKRDPDRWRAAVGALAERWPYHQGVKDLADRIAEEDGMW
ncbi:HEAT repeat domain-containing protein [Actinoplanes subglobosus]|uniref:HEAT repeat domain-containing protein n=1 Tax=Actinoplanes subglobosus TaxID=1547892 RepID=A0ABV8IZB7_9ACTN